eukprot:Nk52_evm1s759 gene=Nk52_evmTU1s759
MLRITKPKNQRSKRYLESREAKVVENTKSALFIKGGNTSETVTAVLKELYSFKKPDAALFKKKNPILPFEDRTSLEFFSNKNDASLFMFGSHSKKRPNNITLGRTFDYQVLDMIEVGVENYIPSLKFVQDYRKKCEEERTEEEKKNGMQSAKKYVELMRSLGTKPCLVFQGEAFEQKEEYAKLKNLLADFFKGPVVENIALGGLEHAMCFTVCEETGNVLMRNYKILMKKSGTRTPYIDLIEMGPSMDFTMRRTWFASEDVQKQAYKVPKEAKAKKVKNIKHDDMGNKMGRIHMQSQDFNKLQLRKVKALKKD